MLTAFAPPAIRYPPINTTSTLIHVGLPATNMGATVVTSRSEMMRGLVSITMSRSNDVCTCSRALRSEERRVGKECRSRWSPEQLKKKKKDTKEQEHR